ncbi:extended synaptotagmin-2 isoform X3 [Contarinia nasturtii]|uniref:extended synaptotagmin-2 isoform X3 n=1 Tax=Contarinia nasturtii TaxID=265458 RepID=UPI0012D3D33E|nr:extended synaptotagmin-2 isoform X3 [Contarinia nasturtii]
MPFPNICVLFPFRKNVILLQSRKRPSAGQDASSSVQAGDDSFQDDLVQLDTGKTKNSDEMAAASKEASKDEPVVKPAASTRSDDSVFTILYSIVKKVSVVGAIYLVGYMNWSVAWLITPVILAVTREYWHKTNETKRAIAKATATSNEKDVILARINDLPAWVYFPDIERCEWINRILQQVWPNANYFAKDLVKDVIEPKIAEALTEYKLNGFKFDRIVLGTIPPRIGGVKVYDKNISRNEIIMDMDLFYASDCDINFQLSGMKAGIKDFQIHGMVRVIMKPLISKMPLVGGLQIFFLNNPDIDFNLVGVADLLDMPGLSDMLRRIIIEQIGAIMVLPNKLPISLSDEVPSITLKMPEPEGVLRIHVVEAKDLMKKDIGVLGKGKSDPYAIVMVGSQQFRTPTIDNTVNPKWDYFCEACFDVKCSTNIGFDLFDWDRTGNNEPLGRATVEISNVVKNGTLDTWITLEQAKHGMLHVRFSWLELSSNASDLHSALAETQLLRVTNLASAVLSVYIDSASDLPQARVQSKPDPFAILSVGKTNQQTAALRRTDAPVWEQGFTFLVANPANGTLLIKIVDQKTEKDLGQFTYILSTLLTKPNLELVSQPFQLQKSGATAKVVISLALKILKKPLNQSSEPVTRGEAPMIQRQPSQMSQTQEVSEVKNVKLAEFPPKLAEIPSQVDSAVDEMIENAKSNVSEFISNEAANVLNDGPQSQLRRRQWSTQSEISSHGLGRIQISLYYSVQRQRLSVTVHKIINIPLKDPSNVPDPYVKCYLLPARSKESKRKTIIVKDSCDPVYDATFEYIISSAELKNTELEVTVATQKGFLSGGSPIIGMLKLPLDDADITTQGISNFYDLQPEIKAD